MWPFKKRNTQKDKVMSTPKFHSCVKEGFTPPELIFNKFDSIEEKTRKIVHADITNDDKWHLFTLLNATMNIRYDPDAFWLYMEMAKQCKREGKYKNSIFYNCFPIIVNLTKYDGSPGGLTHEIAIAIRKNKEPIRKEDFSKLFTQAYDALFSDLDVNVTNLIDVTWKEIVSDGNVFKGLSPECIPSFESSGNASQDENIGRSYEQLKDYDNALKAYQSAFELQKRGTIIPPRIFMRQAIVYRKLKQYDNEIAVIKIGLIYGNKQSTKEMQKLKSRLSRAKQLLSKSKS